MAIDLNKLDNKSLQILIDNHRNKGATDHSLYIEALAEQTRRENKELDLNETIKIVSDAAAKGRFISYAEVASASGANWNKVRYAMGPHLDELIVHCHRNGMPLLSAIVVNKPNITTGALDVDALKGFIAGVHRVEIKVVDSEAFLREQQKKVFEWGRAVKAAKKA
jgi:hypothetical protein